MCFEVDRLAFHAGEMLSGVVFSYKELARFRRKEMRNFYS